MMQATNLGSQRKLFSGLFVLSGLLILGCIQSTTSPISVTNGEAIERITEKGPVILVVRISPPVPRLSDLVDMEVEVSAEPDVEIKPPVFGQAVGDFLVRDYTEKSDNIDKGNDVEAKSRKVRRFRYQLEPVHAGRHLIRSVAIEFVDHRPNSENSGKSSMIESDAIEIEVSSQLGDAIPSLADLEPMLPPQPLSQASNWMWLWLAIPCLLAIGIFGWLRMHRAPTVSTVVQKSPAEIAQAALAMLLAENLPAQGLFQAFYLRLTGIVRQYIEGITGVHAPEQTTEEFLREMRSRQLFELPQSARLQEFLEAADMVKYAGQQPSGDNIELSITRAREFVELRSSIANPTLSQVEA